jgi:porin
MLRKIIRFLFFYLFLANISYAGPLTPDTVSSNPAAVAVVTGNGVAQKYLEKQLGIKNNHGIEFGGTWMVDNNQLFSGGIPNVYRNTSNSAFLFNITADTEKLAAWKGGMFGAEFLQLNAQSTNVQAGTVQGYNSIPGSKPLTRSELYQLWYRQKFFDDKLIVRIGKTLPTYDNVSQPLSLSQQNLNIPAVSSLIFTPLFTNPTMLGVMPGFYNSAYGITMNLVPTRKWYASYGIYDGNLAQGAQTGINLLPTLNGSYFQIAEVGVNWLQGENRKPGFFGSGLWHQSGKLTNFLNQSANSASGFYLFGTQRLWYKNPGIDNVGISSFYQFGVNNSNILSVKKYVGAGLTGFGLVPERFDDSLGLGIAFSWLNQSTSDRATELMYQGYYQAKIIKGVYLEPVLTYIPTPGVSKTLNPDWAGTLRAIILF